MQDFTPKQLATIDALRSAGTAERKIANALPILFPGLEVTHWAIRQDRKDRLPEESK